MQAYDNTERKRRLGVFYLVAVRRALLTPCIATSRLLWSYVGYAGAVRVVVADTVAQSSGGISQLLSRGKKRCS